MEKDKFDLKILQFDKTNKPMVIPLLNRHFTAYSIKNVTIANRYVSIRFLTTQLAATLPGRLKVSLRVSKQF